MNNSTMDHDDLYYYDFFWMDSIGESLTGIPKVILWTGPTAPGNEGKRIKVGNLPANIPADTSFDTFDITLPDLQIIGEVNKSFITPEVLEQIKKWILLNQTAINEHSEMNTTSDEFIPQLKKI